MYIQDNTPAHLTAMMADTFFPAVVSPMEILSKYVDESLCRKHIVHSGLKTSRYVPNLCPFDLNGPERAGYHGGRSALLIPNYHREAVCAYHPGGTSMQKNGKKSGNYLISDFLATVKPFSGFSETFLSRQTDELAYVVRKEKKGGGKRMIMLRQTHHSRLNRPFAGDISYLLDEEQAWKSSAGFVIRTSGSGLLLSGLEIQPPWSRASS